MLSQSKLHWRANLFFNATKIFMGDSLNNQSKTLKYVTTDASTWHLTLSNNERRAFYIHNFPRFKFNLIHDQLEENLPYTWNDFNGAIVWIFIPEDFISSLSSPKSKTAKIPSGFVFVSFLCRRRKCFSDWSRQDLTAIKQTTIIQYDDDDLFFF